ncbi:carbon monoxide dehydrogenase [Aliiroseovarius sp. PrR006]|nr:MHYT domain-containing protein [Aliiroseovarius sp. PrR006]NDW52421.1 carbon monoxide dehydrogenase [Aliiroseovarius sp. PrR006]
MASFTGLSLTRGASKLKVAQRKVTVAMAAIALGVGVWAMHFVAMLGLQLPILFYYDALITLASALIAILIMGVALLILHFRERTTTNVTIAGAIVGLGIPVMHYVGMYGIQLCRATYTLKGLLTAVAISLALSIAAIWIAYGKRDRMNIVIGTIGFSTAVVAMHFVAISGTSFWEVVGETSIGPLVRNEALAIMVLLISFLICGAFLLSGITFMHSAPQAAASRPLVAPSEMTEGMSDEDVFERPSFAGAMVNVPYEQDGQTLFVDGNAVAFIQAEGHYTVLYADDKKLFCPWSISEAESRLPSPYFIRSHRSYLINPALVSRFERKKDNGICHFDLNGAQLTAPVSRTKLATVRAALGV